MTDLEGVLVRVTTALDGAGVRYMLIGGLANLVWGEVRGTTDVDLVVDIGGMDAAEFVTLASQLGDPQPPDPERFVERTRVLPIRTQGVAVDFLVATLSFELEALDRARDVEMGGRTVRVCSPDDLVLFKVVGGRAQDIRDLVGILRRRRDELDWERLERAVRALDEEVPELGIGERWRDAKRQAGIEG